MYRVLQFMNPGFIFPGGFAQYKFPFNQPDQPGGDCGKDDGDLSRVLFLVRELIQAEAADDEKQPHNTPKPSGDRNKPVFIQKDPP